MSLKTSGHKEYYYHIQNTNPNPAHCDWTTEIFYTIVWIECVVDRSMGRIFPYSFATESVEAICIYDISLLLCVFNILI